MALIDFLTGNYPSMQDALEAYIFSKKDSGGRTAKKKLVLPSLTLPEIDMPSSPTITAPSMPSLPTPTLPTFDVPEVPKVVLPLPTITPPTLPPIALPPVPKIDIPVPLPKVDIPIPKVELPNIPLPKIEPPKIELPKAPDLTQFLPKLPSLPAIPGTNIDDLVKSMLPGVKYDSKTGIGTFEPTVEQSANIANEIGKLIQRIPGADVIGGGLSGAAGAIGAGASAVAGLISTLAPWVTGINLAQSIFENNRDAVKRLFNMGKDYSATTPLAVDAPNVSDWLNKNVSREVEWDNLLGTKINPHTKTADNPIKSQLDSALSAYYAKTPDDTGLKAIITDTNIDKGLRDAIISDIPGLKPDFEKTRSLPDGTMTVEYSYRDLVAEKAAADAAAQKAAEEKAAMDKYIEDQVAASQKKAQEDAAKKAAEDAAKAAADAAARKAALEAENSRIVADWRDISNSATLQQGSDKLSNYYSNYLRTKNPLWRDNFNAVLIRFPSLSNRANYIAQYGW